MTKKELIERINTNRCELFFSVIRGIRRACPEWKYAYAIGVAIQVTHRRLSHGVYAYCRDSYDDELEQDYWEMCTTFFAYCPDRLKSIKTSTVVSNYDAFQEAEDLVRQRAMGHFLVGA